MIRIGAGQGFWGDWLEAPVRLVQQGPLNYLVLDYLAEVTMSILQKQKSRNPNLGYALDFPELIQRIAPEIRDKRIKVLANAGGVNPLACAQDIRSRAPQLKVAVVLGDDILSRIPHLVAAGHSLTNIDTGRPITDVLPRLTSANAYLGAFPLAQALAMDADVVVTGRCADAALVLAPMIHEFGWREDQYNLLAQGVIAGHVVECGAQCTGGNCQADWQSIPNLANIGYPIVEAHPDGTCIITKHENTGGRVSLATVKEQIVYEIGDPAAYYTPDVIADFTTVHLHQEAENRVRLSNCRGHQRPEKLKISASYSDGFKATGSLVYSWPDALPKAQAADRIVRQRLAQLNLPLDTIATEFFGYNATHGPAAQPPPDPSEIMLRIAVRSHDKAAVERFTREMIPLVLNGPPTATGYGDGRPEVKDIIAYWPALLDRDQVPVHVEIFA